MTVKLDLTSDAIAIIAVIAAAAALVYSENYRLQLAAILIIILILLMMRIIYPDPPVLISVVTIGALIAFGEEIRDDVAQWFKNLGKVGSGVSLPNLMSSILGSNSGRSEKKPEEIYSQKFAGPGQYLIIGPKYANKYAKALGLKLKDEWFIIDTAYYHYFLILGGSDTIDKEYIEDWDRNTPVPTDKNFSSLSQYGRMYVKVCSDEPGDDRCWIIPVKATMVYFKLDRSLAETLGYVLTSVTPLAGLLAYALFGDDLEETRKAEELIEKSEYVYRLNPSMAPEVNDVLSKAFSRKFIPFLDDMVQLTLDDLKALVKASYRLYIHAYDALGYPGEEV